MTIFGGWSLAMPLKMIVPSPPALTYAATTVTLITVTAAMRSPATITGIASGNSTFHRISDSLIPIPRAASVTSAGTSRMPVAMLRTRIISEKATMQMIAFVLPSPTRGISSARKASVGIVYRIPLTAIAAPNTRWLRAAAIPIASDSTNAIASADPAMTRCSPSAIATWSQLRRNHVIGMPPRPRLPRAPPCH